MRKDGSIGRALKDSSRQRSLVISNSNQSGMMAARRLSSKSFGSLFTKSEHFFLILDAQ